MKINEFSFQYGIKERRVVRFKNHFNLVFSDENTKGKTTLLRMLLYALGFSVPDMKGIDFADLNYSIKGFDCEGNSFEFERIICADGYKCHFVTSQSDDLFIAETNERVPLHSHLFKNLNQAVQDNILGVFYIDQEKGWNLLNRGKVIGNNRFGIEELLCGLQGTDISKIKYDIAKTQKEIEQYQKLFSFAEFAQGVQEAQGQYETWDANQHDMHECAVIDIRIKNLSVELEQLKELRKDNSTLLDMIDGLNLVVRTSSEEELLVTRDNLVGFKENLAYLLMRIDILKHKIASLKRARASLVEKMPMLHDASDNLLNTYRSRIHGLELNQVLIHEAIVSLRRQSMELRSELRRLAHNHWANQASCHVIDYLDKLRAIHNYKYSNNAILTNDLAPYSGAELSKRVLAFRFALLKCIKQASGIALPIIIDSPYSKEIDGENFRRMLSILKNEFCEHQIIIASIHKEDMCVPYTRITIVDGILDSDAIIADYQ